MIRRVLIALAISITATPAIGQDSRENTIRELTQRLIELNKIMEPPSDYTPTLGGQVPEWYRDLYLGQKVPAMQTGIIEGVDVIISSPVPVKVYENPDGPPAGTLVEPGKIFNVSDVSGRYVNLIDKRGDKVGWVDYNNVIPTGYLSDSVNKKIEDAMQYVSDLYEDYKNNEYVRVSGFNIVVGISPSVGVNFEFK